MESGRGELKGGEEVEVEEGKYFWTHRCFADRHCLDEVTC